MSDLLSWLRSTIEGDKAAAEAAAKAPRKVEYHFPDGPDASGREWEEREVPDGGSWFVEGERVMSHPEGMDARLGGVVGGSCGCCWGDAEGRDVDLAHIALHDPRDTIARCEAELALLDAHPAAAGTYLPDWAGRCQGCGEFVPCTTVKLLASGRRYRPGFNPEWVS